MIEDACHALGGNIRLIKKFFLLALANMQIYRLFHCTLLSLLPREGGLITTNNKKVFEKALLFRSHGIVRKKIIIGNMMLFHQVSIID